MIKSDGPLLPIDAWCSGYQIAARLSLFERTVYHVSVRYNLRVPRVPVLDLKNGSCWSVQGQSESTEKEESRWIGDLHWSVST